MPEPEVILETRGLSKEFRGFIAVKRVDLRVVRGTIHALIGPNGAGKTTCFNLLTRFLPATNGTITYKGQDIVETIHTFVKEYAITHIVLGRSQRPWYRRLFRRSLLERVLATVPHVDVLVVAGQGLRQGAGDVGLGPQDAALPRPVAEH